MLNRVVEVFGPYMPLLRPLVFVGFVVITVLAFYLSEYTLVRRGYVVSFVAWDRVYAAIARNPADERVDLVYDERCYIDTREKALWF